MLVSRGRLSAAGDTIVEVLIAMAVLTFILVGAYVSTNSSLQGENDAQERINAVKLAEAQLEVVKAVSTNSGSISINTLYGETGPFCILVSGGTMTLYSSSNSFPAPAGSHCVVDTSGNPTSGLPAFQLAVNVSVDAAGTHTFTVTDTWASTGGHVDNVALEYRVD